MRKEKRVRGHIWGPNEASSQQPRLCWPWKTWACSSFTAWNPAKAESQTTTSICITNSTEKRCLLLVVFLYIFIRKLFMIFYRGVLGEISYKCHDDGNPRGNIFHFSDTDRPIVSSSCSTILFFSAIKERAFVVLLHKSTQSNGQKKVAFGIVTYASLDFIMTFCSLLVVLRAQWAFEAHASCTSAAWASENYFFVRVWSQFKVSRLAWKLMSPQWTLERTLKDHWGPLRKAFNEPFWDPWRSLGSGVLRTF